MGNPAQPLVIEVTGHQFWWDIRCPEAGVRTANEIQVPVGKPVELHVTSTDVIHALWVPQLGGKIDMTPVEDNTPRLQADEPGVYRGLCTEYCGIQHAQMHFIVVAMPPEDFDAWLAERVDPPQEPTDALAQRGREVFVAAQCALCHTVDGVSPDVDLGPDLTHFGSRLTIGAGQLDNEPDNLAAWILDPQSAQARQPHAPLQPHRRGAPGPHRLPAVIAMTQGGRARGTGSATGRRRQARGRPRPKRMPCPGTPRLASSSPAPPPLTPAGRRARRDGRR